MTLKPCPQCSAEGPAAITPEEVARLWNTRTSEGDGNPSDTELMVDCLRVVSANRNDPDDLAPALRAVRALFAGRTSEREAIAEMVDAHADGEGLYVAERLHELADRIRAGRFEGGEK